METAKTVNSYKVGVLVGGETSLAYNALRFATKEQAEEYGKDLASRWWAVISWEVQPSEDTPNRGIEQ